MKNPKTVEELKKRAVIFWPAEICKQEKATSVIPLLLESQEKFISILHLADAAPLAWKEILGNVEGLPPNLSTSRNISTGATNGWRKWQGSSSRAEPLRC